MSSYLRYTRHPKDKCYYPAAWVDDYFGNHNYGVKFLDGGIFDAREHDMPTTPEIVHAEWSDFFPAAEKDTPTVSTAANINPNAAPTVQKNAKESSPQQTELRTEIEKIVVQAHRYRTIPTKTIDKLESLFNKYTNSVRVDELEMAIQQFIFNTKSNPHNFSEYAHARIQTLSPKEGGKE